MKQYCLYKFNMAKFAKLIRNGRGQAVRLPKEFQFQGDRVLIRRVPTGVLLQPVIDVKEWFAAMDKLSTERLKTKKRNQPGTPPRKIFE